MSDDPRHNVLVGLGIAFGCLILISFLSALLSSNPGEIASALGSLLGGIVGAGGAVLTVFLLIERQRGEEADRVTKAIRMEITGFTKFLIGALECCEHIKLDRTKVPKKNARSIMTFLDPIIYKSTADRISLTPFPHQVIAFYTRVVEVQEKIQIIIDSPGHHETPIQPAMAKTIAESLIAACQLAIDIISHQPSSGLDGQVSKIEIKNIDAALAQAQTIFPEANAFRVRST